MLFITVASYAHGAAAVPTLFTKLQLLLLRLNLFICCIKNLVVECILQIQFLCQTLSSLFGDSPSPVPKKGLSKVRLDWREDVQRDRVVLSGVKFSPLYGERDKSSCSTEQRKLQLIPKTHAQSNSAAGTPPGPASS